MSEERFSNLIGILKDMESALLAYSGGVDSTLLLKALSLSGITCLAVTSNSETMPSDDMLNAIFMAKAMGIELRTIKTNELENEDYLRNPPERCFYCKNELFSLLKDIAQKEGYNFVIDGSNLDDLKDYRPGRTANVKHEIRSPLIEAGFRKTEIREISKELGLPTWNKPSSPCLSSRFPYGMRITPDALKQVASAEGFLKSMGFKELRVRHLGDTARIELKEEDIARILEIKASVVKKLNALGYRFVLLDLEGLRRG
ncbi:MAG: ATP-dependent sacrificial sulfur transferase LarE [Nitrospirae bacterium]|nr:ATP-dependent sacrificial sulfur transferase LarE [Nitrospirota bacterium]